MTEALPNNPKVQEVEGKYLFKPPLPVRDRKSLLKLLRQHDMKGHGGVLLDDIQESLPHCDKVMKVGFPVPYQLSFLKIRLFKDYEVGNLRKSKILVGVTHNVRK